MSHHLQLLLLALLCVTVSLALPQAGSNRNVHFFSPKDEVLDASMPLPFTRSLVVQNPPLEGDDVIIAQNLLMRSPVVNGVVPLSGVYDAATSKAVALFQQGNGINLPPSLLGVLESVTANWLLKLHEEDGYRDSGDIPPGYMYKIYIPVFRNRSIETVAILYAANMSVLHTWTVRTHGQNDPVTGLAYGQLVGSGVTPTGLSEVDLNSPEDDPKSFGPYPINRFVRGLQGNHAINAVYQGVNRTFISDIRDGILLHTGEWDNWAPPMPMPNSHGCVHGYPDDVKAVWQLLISIGVQMRNNTDGKLPYPYKAQGVVSVELVS